MTVVNALQLALAAGASWLIVRRAYVLWWRAPVSLPLLRSALEPALAAGHFALAARLAEACQPAWAAQLATRLIELRGSEERVAAAATELSDDFAFEASRGQLAVRGLGRMAAPLAFIGVILEISQAFSGGRGLVAMQRGLAASIGLERAIFTFSIGLATAIVCFTAAALMRRRAQRLCDELSELVRVLSPALGDGGALDRNRGDV